MKTARAEAETFLIASAILAIAVDLGLARLGFGLTLPAIRAELPGSFGTYGAIATWHFVGYLAGSLMAPAVLRRDFGGRRTAVVSHVFVALLLLGSALTHSLVALGALRALLGVACGLGIASVITGTLERVAAPRRSATSGIVWSGLAVGVILSAVAAPSLLAAHSDWRAATVVAAALASIAALLLWFSFASAPPRVAAIAKGVSFEASFGVPDEAPFHPADILRPDRYLMLICSYFLFGVAYTAFATFFVAALRTSHASPTTIAYVWGIFGVAALAGGLCVGRLMAWRNDALSIYMGAGAAGAAIASIGSPAANIAGAVAIGAGLAGTAAVATALARARSSAETSASAFVAVTAIFGGGQIVGPVVAGALADRFGPSAVTLFAASAYALGAAFGLVDARLARKVQFRSADNSPDSA